MREVFCRFVRFDEEMFIGALWCRRIFIFRFFFMFDIGRGEVLVEGGGDRGKRF